MYEKGNALNSGGFEGYISFHSQPTIQRKLDAMCQLNCQVLFVVSFFMNKKKLVKFLIASVQLYNINNNSIYLGWLYLS